MEKSKINVGQEVSYLNNLDVYVPAKITRVDKFRNGSIRNTYSLVDLSNPKTHLHCGVHVSRIKI